MRSLLFATLLAGGYVSNTAASPQSTSQPALLSSEQIQQDIEHFIEYVRLGYAYRDDKPTDFATFEQCIRHQSVELKTKLQLSGRLNHCLEHWFDHHADVTPRPKDYYLPMPTATGLWAQWRNGQATITAVPFAESAYQQGFRAGMQILRIDGTAVEQAIEQANVSGFDTAKSWTLNRLLTGKRKQRLSLEVRRQGKTEIKLLDIEAIVKDVIAEKPLLTQKRIGTVGYIRPENSLGNNALISAFDEAMAQLKDTQAMILDLRHTPSGGNTEVARGIMSRFIKAPQPYQIHELVSIEREFGVKRVWQEFVYPRGDFQYDKQLIVLCNKWTGSMGEGLTIGLHGMKRATVIGTQMSQLLGAIYGETLPHSELNYMLPREKLYHVDGTPREAFVPDIVVEQRQYNQEQDATLQAALDWLNKPQAD
ncbi:MULTISPECIES: S41 family peptidase [unclassified Pseudoalteromonas]|uniref:S41 family peptidase n=1 Tax=unclassified Pseudoalteromonas TaxID=194690 RepID=UPI0020978BC8|nr:S41 family peptidase [Pseudoalteromonas sp. XMcav2-N]MCO7187493.1 S41 family peptidase [Pseudoalteromonas sp. XMcav2-N]